MPSTSPKADTAAWRDLLSWIANAELHQLLDELGAWMAGERLRAAALPVRLEAAPLDLVAEVLDETYFGPVPRLGGERDRAR